MSRSRDIEHKGSVIAAALVELERRRSAQSIEAQRLDQALAACKAAIARNRKAYGTLRLTDR